jgi:hypothetical protein
MSTISLTLRLLHRQGFVAEVCERWLPKIEKRRDLFYCGDVIGCHARRREILLVQTTTLPNLGARLKKARQQPELASWLAAGGLFELHGWCKRGGRWTCKRIAVTGQDLVAETIVSPPRRRKRLDQGLLF